MHDYSNKCECSTVGYSLISACVACQNRDPFLCDHTVSSRSPRAYGSIFSLSLAGLHMWPTAQLFYLLHSEFRGEEPIAFDIEYRFPGSQTLSLREYVFLTGLFSMSRFVLKFFF
jgi:hypothetical protein